jgi:hypothetical protein
MKRSLLFFVIFAAATMAGSVCAQTRTVTNADLEKFRAARLKAEQDYRENYAKWGMPSPEELEKRRVQAATELSERAARMRAEMAEQERSYSEQQQQAALYSYLRTLNAPSHRVSSPYVYDSLPYGFYNSRSFGRGRQFQQYGPGNTPLPTLGPPRYDFLPGSVLPTRRRH